MELRHLRYFIAVAEKLSFTKAAEKLHLAQPSLTRQIRNLEEEIGVRLLNRSKSQVTLTEEGKGFLVDAQHLIALASESIDTVQRVSRGEAGSLTIAYLPNFNCISLPKTLELFSSAYPNIGLNLLNMTPAEQIRSLEDDKIDVAFVGLRFSTSPKNLQWECIARQKAVVVLPLKHPLARRGHVSLRELKGMFFVGVSEKTQPGFREWLCGICQQAEFTPRVLEDAESELSLLAFVAQGLGIALAREQIGRLAGAEVVCKAIVPPVDTDYWIAWNRNNRSSSLVNYIQIIRELGKGATQG